MTTLPADINALRLHLRDSAERAVRALGVTDFQLDLAPAPNPELGDFGFPCFKLAKALKKAPPLIAAELAAQIPPDEVIEEVVVEKAYVNFRLKRQTLAEVVLGQAIAQKAAFGGGQIPPEASEHWMVEYSAPNTNKPLHLGHLRNNLLGASVSKLLSFLGHRVTRINLVNDRGVHICKSMLAYQLWGEGITPEASGQKGDKLVGDCYVRFDQQLSAEYAAWQQSAAGQAKLAAWEASPAGQAELKAAAKQAKGEAPPSAAALFFGGYKDAYFNSESLLGAQVRQMLVAWEEGVPEVRALWRRMNDWVLAGFEASYRRMGVGFEHVQYESQTYTLGKAIVQQGLEQGLLTQRADGAIICELEKIGLKGEKVLLRSDGTSVYMTQDLGTAAERFAEFNLDRLVYVVGDEQNYHFELLFKILGLIHPGYTERCQHLGYGMIRLPHGRMKSREGTVVDADDLMDEMQRLARVETEARAAEGKAHAEGISAEELELRAERIGMSALKYYLLKYSPRSSFEYDPKASIDFLGQTGPYALFNYARTRSLLRKAGGEPAFSAAATHRLGTDQELGIIRQLFAWPEVLEKAALGLDPSRVAEYVFELCRAFAFIFTDKDNHPIATCDDALLRQGRLLLAAAVGNTVEAGLALLGVEVLEEM